MNPLETLLHPTPRNIYGGTMPPPPPGKSDASKGCPRLQDRGLDQVLRRSFSFCAGLIFRDCSGGEASGGALEGKTGRRSHFESNHAVCRPAPRICQFMRIYCYHDASEYCGLCFNH